MRADARSLIDFIATHPSPFHVVAGFRAALEKEGFRFVPEGEAMPVVPGGKYVTTRNGSALIAFSIPASAPKAFSMVAAHTDSPSWRIKDHAVLPSKDGYVSLNTEGYGGMLMAPWFDRPLSLAGRAFYEKDGEVRHALVDFPRDLCMIPSLAIHMNRNANHGIDYNVQKELQPLIGWGEHGFSLRKLVGDRIGVDEKSVLEMDLTLYNRNPGTIWGLQDEFFSSPKIDDLECAYDAVASLIDAEPSDTIAMAVLFDNEEVGSGSKQGALGDFLTDTLDRLAEGLGWSAADARSAKSRSFMLSADNGHAVHPNYPEACDPTNRPVMGGGVLVKFAANQKYTTDAASASWFESLLRKRGIPFQTFFNNSNIPGGSTLGNLSTRHYSIPTVDIGCAQLAMHSPYETASVADVGHLYDGMRCFFERPLWRLVD